MSSFRHELRQTILQSRCDKMANMRNMRLELDVEFQRVFREPVTPAVTYAKIIFGFNLNEHGVTTWKRCAIRTSWSKAKWITSSNLDPEYGVWFNMSFAVSISRREQLIKGTCVGFWFLELICGYDMSTGRFK